MATFTFIKENVGFKPNTHVVYSSAMDNDYSYFEGRNALTKAKKYVANLGAYDEILVMTLGKKKTDKLYPITPNKFLTDRQKFIIKAMRDGALLTEYSYAGQEWSLAIPNVAESIDLWREEDYEAIRGLRDESVGEIIVHSGIFSNRQANRYVLTQFGKLINLK